MGIKNVPIARLVVFSYKRTGFFVETIKQKKIENITVKTEFF